LFKNYSNNRRVTLIISLVGVMFRVIQYLSMLVNEESIAAALVVLCELSGVTISHLCVTRTYIYRTYL